MGTSHLYDITAAQPGRTDAGAGKAQSGVEISLDNPEELQAMGKEQLDAAYATASQQQAAQREDFSDMVAEHQVLERGGAEKGGDMPDWSVSL